MFDYGNIYQSQSYLGNSLFNWYKANKQVIIEGVFVPNAWIYGIFTMILLWFGDSLAECEQTTMIGFHVDAKGTGMTFNVKQNGYSDILLLPFFNFSIDLAFLCMLEWYISIYQQC